MQDATAEQAQAQGRAMQQFGQSIGAMAGDLQDEYDAAKVNKAMLAAESVLDDEIGGYLGTVGEQATGDAADKALAAARKRLQPLQMGLDNERQRRVFQDAAERRSMQWTQRATKHRDTQTREFAFGMYTAQAQAAGMRAVATVGQPEFLDNKAQMLASVDNAADVQGLGEDQKKLLRLGATTKMHENIIGNLVQGGHATAARDYLSGAAGEVDPGTLTKLQKLVENAGIDDQAQTLADSSVASAGTLVGALDEIQRQYSAGGIDVRVRDRAMDRARMDVQQRRAAVESDRKNALSEALEWTAGGSPLTPQMHVALEATGQLWKYEALQESGGNYRTTGYGFRALHTATDADLLAFKSPDEVWNHYRTEMSNDELPLMVAKWHKANEAAGKASLRSAEQAQKDAIALNFDEEALYHFRRQPDVPDDWSPKGKDNRVSPAMFETWKRNLRITANQLTGKAGLADTNTKIVTEAADSLLRHGHLQVIVDGTVRNKASLTTEQFQGGKVALSPDVAKKIGTDYFDIRLNTDPNQPDALFLEATDQLLGRFGKDAQFTEQDVYDQMASIVAARNTEQLAVVAREKSKGSILVGDRLMALVDDPDVGREMFLAMYPNYEDADRRRPADVPIIPTIFGGDGSGGVFNPARKAAFKSVVRSRLQPIAESYSMTAAELDSTIDAFMQQGYAIRRMDAGANDIPTGGSPQLQR